MHISTTVSRMMIQLSCRRRTASMSDGQSTSASCSIDPPQSISVPWTKFPRNPLLNALTSVNRKTIWVILSNLGCTKKFVNLIRLLYDDINGLVLSDGKASEQFNITDSVMQGCIFAPVLFNFLTCDLNHAIRDFKQGVYRKGPCLTYAA